MLWWSLESDFYIGLIWSKYSEVICTNMKINKLTDYSIVIMTNMVVKDEKGCLLYTSPSPRDPNRSRMPSSA